MFSSLKKIMNYSDSMLKVRGIMARYIIASRCKDKRSIYDELTVLDYERADYMMLVLSMEETVGMLTTQDLSGLAVYWQGCVCWTKGRMGLSESRVKMMKKSLIHLHSGGELNYAEFESVLARAADIINDRPLGVRVHGKAEGDL